MNFGFLLFPDLEELDLVGPWEIVNVWRAYANGPEHCFTVSQQGGEVRCSKGLKLMADYSFKNCPPLDYLLILLIYLDDKEVGCTFPLQL